MRFPVEQDLETLVEYRDSFEERHQEIENLVLGLEKEPGNMDDAHTLRDIFYDLWSSSTKLSLSPISENAELIVQSFDFIIEQNCYPPQFSEYLLLLIDKLLLIIRDVEQTNSIDMLKVQNIHVSLQDIILSKTCDELTNNIPSAITHITREAPGSETPLSDDFDVVLFEDDESAAISLFDDEPEEPEEPETQEQEEQIEAADIHIPSSTLDPVLQAQEFITAHQSDPIAFLGEISDIHTTHGTNHTEFLLEITLAMNIMEGSPLALEDLWAGICLHDIGLADLTAILNAERKLTEEELALVKQHPIKGSVMADKFVHSEDCTMIILHHHERLDGRGYPYGLKRTQISEGGKMLAIVDSFHAQVSHRPHKRYTRGVLRAVSEINACTNSHYDPRWVTTFNKCIKDYWLPKHT